MNPTNHVSLALTLIEDNVKEVRRDLNKEVERIDKKLDLQTKVLSGILVTSVISALQSIGIHTSSWMPDAIRILLGTTHI